MSTPDTLPGGAVRSFADRLDGSVVEPGDPNYDDARSLWNGMFDREPALVARCTTTEDVATAVAFARERDLRLAVKSTGHDFAGKSVCDDGLVVDLSRMDDASIDCDEGTVVAEPGATWGDVYDETQPLGLAPAGGPSQIGIAGYTLGGGLGPLSRKYGLALDDLRSAEVVTATGTVVRASETENADLFWGIRGGSGNFGVVTSFEFELRDVGPQVLAGVLYYPFDDAAKKLRFYDRFMSDAPDELTCSVMIHDARRLQGVAETLHGESLLCFKFCYCGDVDDGRELLEPFYQFGDPVVDTLQPRAFGEFAQGRERDVDRFLPKSHFLRGLSDEAIDTIVAYGNEPIGPFTTIRIGTLGGAINRVDGAETAFAHRDAAYEIDVWAGWSDPALDDAIVGWTRAFHDDMAPYATGGVYVNQLNRHEDDRVEAAYGSNYDRLAALKAEWDPGNLFRLNHNVEPANDD